MRARTLLVLAIAALPVVVSAVVAVAIPVALVPAAAAAARPDLVLEPPGGIDAVPSLGTGRAVGYDVVITNRGAAVGATTLRIALPAGAGLDPARGVQRVVDGGAGRVHCSGFATATPVCSFGDIGAGQQVHAVVGLIARRNARVGTTAPLYLTIVPSGVTDRTPPDNHYSGRVRFTGAAALHFTLHPAEVTVRIGHTVRIGLHVSNSGPDRAVGAAGLVAVGAEHFTITGYSTSRRVPGSSLTRLHTGSARGGALRWTLGTVGTSGTTYAQVTVRAVDPGSTTVLFLGSSQSGDPACDGSGTAHCGESAGFTLHAVR